MSLHLSFRTCALLFFLFVTTLPATAAEWIIAKVSGEAWIESPGIPAVKAIRGMTIPDGATFSTRKNARAQLERGTETIVVSPNSVLSPRESSFFGTTAILHQVGRIDLDVEKRNSNHFSVETPFLAAVVKGTRFTVTVSDRAADVRVERGLVEVTDLSRGEAAYVAPGQRASVAATGSQGLQVRGLGKPPEIRQAPVRAPQVESLRPNPTTDRPTVDRENGSDKGRNNDASKGGGNSGNANGGSSHGPGNSGGNSGGAGGKGSGHGGGGADGGSSGKGGGNSGSSGKDGNSGGGAGNGGSKGGNEGGRGNGNGNGNGDGRGGDNGGGGKDSGRGR